MIDPWIERDPRWQPRADSVECALVPNANDFVREAQRIATPRYERPNLPPGVHLQLQADGGWALFVPTGSAGYRRVDGTRDELLELAATWTTE